MGGDAVEDVVDAFRYSIENADSVGTTVNMAMLVAFGHCFDNFPAIYALVQELGATVLAHTPSHMNILTQGGNHVVVYMIGHVVQSYPAIAAATEAKEPAKAEEPESPVAQQG